MQRENWSGHAYHEHSQEEAYRSAPPPLSTAGMVQIVRHGSHRSDAVNDERHGRHTSMDSRIRHMGQYGAQLGHGTMDQRQ